MSEFRAAWWCRNRHVQTLWGPLFRRQRLSFRRERVVLADGDFVDLDWRDAPTPLAGTADGGLASRARLSLVARAERVALRDAARAALATAAAFVRAHQASVRAIGAAGTQAAVAGLHAAAFSVSRPGASLLETRGPARVDVRAPAPVVAGASAAPARGRPPVVLVLHGLEGSSTSHYVVGLLEGIHARGWRGVALNFRSCSGEMNRLPRFYHSGETGDLDAVVGLLLTREPGLRLGLVGVSLGGNVLLKWLGERGASAPAAVAGGVGISVPFDLTSCARVLDRGFGKHVYTANFLRTMRRKAVEKARAYPGYVDVAAARRARTFGEYDRAVTAPLFGFADERDYWRRASCRPFLARIARPALVINAIDDPFVPPDAVPEPPELSPSVHLTLTQRGGHVGFLDGRWPWAADSWAERRALDFLDPLLRD